MWVSATAGSDANPCTRAEPCRDLSTAVNAVVEDGEVVILDSGVYDAVEITKSVQVVAPEGVHAVIAPAAGIPVPESATGATAAVLINAPDATVILRNLTVNREGAIHIGIRVSSVRTLQIENCVVNAFNGPGLEYGGIFFEASGRLSVRDTTLRSNSRGIVVTAPSGGTAHASIDGCRLDGNTFGVVAFGGARTTVSNTVAANGSATGFAVSAAPGTTSHFSCDHCTASNLTMGFVAGEGAGAVMRVSNSVATNNSYGFYKSGLYSTFKSLAGTNMVEGNQTNRFGQIITFSPDAP
ncbi:MAG TPA: right-handed parallel beta-helix repeat-containing protein [Pyrinomonadaceae bacterium]